MIETIEESKCCPRCNETKLLTEFGVCRARKDNLNLYCKLCAREKVYQGRQGLREYKAQRPKRKESVKSRKKPITDGSIDAGLLLLSLATPRGITQTLDDIAYVCGCSRSFIGQIETDAIRKLRQSNAVSKLRDFITVRKKAA